MRLARNIGLLGALVTLIISPNTNLDPINIIKFSCLIIGAGYLMADYPQVLKSLRNSSKAYRIFVFATLLGVTYQLIGLAFTDAPFWQKVFGAFGRNTGFLTYLSLGVIALVTSTIREINQVKVIVKFFILVMGLEIVYGLMQSQGIDPYSWKNLYNPIIGTLGNPNFSSAFYGLSSALILPLIFSAALNSRYRIFLACCYPILFFLTVKSDSWQGTGLFLLSAAIFILIKIRELKRLSFLGYPVVVFYGLISVLAINGFRGIGPLGEYLNKPTFTIRIEYWNTALNTIIKFPFLGVGSDSFGDWFRIMRDESTANRIGPNFTTNSAHNIVLDMMANTGVLVGLTYIVIVLMILWKSLPLLWSPERNSNPIFVPIFLAWFAYQIQSLVSINQIGLGIWGWILQGLMVAVVLNKEQFDTSQSPAVITKHSKNSKDQNPPSLFRFVSTPIAMVIGVIPLYADANFLSAIKLGDVEKVYAAATAFPLEVARINFVTQAFSTNKFPEQALKSARFGVEKFPNNYDTWDLLRQVTNLDSDRELAIENLKRLNPYYEKFSLK